MKIFCGTWNVKGKQLLNSELSEWFNLEQILKPEGVEESVSGIMDVPSDETRADLYAIGLQCIVPLNAVNILLDSSTAIAHSTYWQDKIMQSISTKKKKFNLIASKHLVGIFLCVYATEAIATTISDVRTMVQPTGVFGLGNKGVVGIRMNLCGRSACFISAHMANDNQKRNKDYHEIITKGIFEPIISTNGLADDSGENRSLTMTRSMVLPSSQQPFSSVPSSLTSPRPHRQGSVDSGDSGADALLARTDTNMINSLAAATIQPDPTKLNDRQTIDRQLPLSILEHDMVTKCTRIFPHFTTYELSLACRFFSWETLISD